MPTELKAKRERYDELREQLANAIAECSNPKHLKKLVKVQAHCIPLIADVLKWWLANKGKS